MIVQRQKCSTAFSDTWTTENISQTSRENSPTFLNATLRKNTLISCCIGSASRCLISMSLGKFMFHEWKVILKLGTNSVKKLIQKELKELVLKIYLWSIGLADLELERICIRKLSPKRAVWLWSRGSSSNSTPNAEPSQWCSNTVRNANFPICRGNGPGKLA